VSLGGAADLWGYGGLTPAEVNDPTFSVRITAEAHDGQNSDFNIYSVQAKVYYG
jgi:hypothetical protein